MSTTGSQLHTHTPGPVLGTHSSRISKPFVSWSSQSCYYITMNAQNGQAAAVSALTSPLPNRQLFSAGAQTVETRTNPTRAAVTDRRSDNAMDNDCTIINIATYNIRDGQNSNLEAALWACEKMWIDVAVLTETKLSTDRYTRSAYGYTVFATRKMTHTS
jgi:hypothetical protein